MKPWIPLSLAAGLALSLPAFASAQAAAEDTTAKASLADTKAALRDVWIGHIFWVRNVVDARFEGNEKAAKVAEQQVVANAREIAGAIEPFYGEEASEKLFELLAGHWGAISDYLDATRADSKSDQDAAFQRLVDNADAIAEFLAGANPNWPVDTLRSLLTAHGSHHVQQIQQFDAGEFEEEAKTWAMMTDNVYVIADALAEGIARQFPDKFR
ncbi:MAG TPA: hypothetical protein VFG91_00945 [Woeseiaceae bacterium]|nr:hypothetical protein [Woeseiaceae bacterium]